MTTPLLQQALEALERLDGWLNVRHLGGLMPEEKALATAIRAHLEEPKGGPWEGGEGWESLAWELCADENGEESCNKLIWEGGTVPEPWGERWLKYEDEAKRLIQLVQKHTTASPPSDTVSRDAADGDFAMLDDEGRQMMANSHHYTVKDIRALIDDLKAVEQGNEQPEWINRDHRTRCGVIWRVMAALASDVPVSPLTEAEKANQQDTQRLDAMQRHRIAVVPEYEGPWDAVVYREEGEPVARGTGNTPREAIDAAMHSSTPTVGGEG